MARAIDINCDMGAGIGKFVPEHDPDIMPLITSANVPAGFHGGDPHLIRRTTELAHEHGVGVGVHPGLPDLVGGGNRTMDATPEEVRDYVVYQLGAVRAFADQIGAEFTHVKPHGAMYEMLSESEAHTRAVLQGVLDVDTDLVYVASDMNIYEVAQEFPIRTIFEGYADMGYNPDGTVHTSLRRDPEWIADRFVHIATEGTVEATNGKWIDLPAETICVHGRTPESVDALEAIHERLDEESIEPTRLDELV